MLTPLAFSPSQATCTWPPALQSEREEYGVDCIPENPPKLRGELGVKMCVCVVGLHAPLLHGDFAAKCFWDRLALAHVWIPFHVLVFRMVSLCLLFSSGWEGRGGY